MDADGMEMLRFVNKIHRHEMERHEQTIGSIFNWTLTTLLALGAGFIGFASSNAWHNSHQPLLRLLVGLLGFAMSLTAIKEIVERKDAFNANARVVARVSILMDLFDDNRFGREHDPLYPSEWKGWGGEARSAAKFLPTFHSLVLLMVSSAIAFVSWLI